MFQKNSSIEKFYAKEGISRFCVEIGLSHSTQTFRKGTYLCFRKIRVSKSFMHKKGTSLFFVENFCLTVPNNIAGDPSVLQKNVVPKYLILRSGASWFCRKLFVSQCQEFSWGNPSMFQNFLGYPKVFCIRRGYLYSPLKFFCLTVPKHFVEEPFCASKNFWYRKF